MTKPRATFAMPDRIKCAAAVFITFAAGYFAPMSLVLGAEDDATLLKDAQRVFKPLPKDAATEKFPVTPDRVKLGRMLFFDPRISIDGVGSCVRCHLPALYGADALPKSRGVRDQEVPRNAPTVL